MLCRTGGFVSVVFGNIEADTVDDSYSGEYQSALQMDATWTGQSLLSAQPRRARVNLYLPE